jgi:Rrf2 family protein
MNLSAKTEYACVVMMHRAREHSNRKPLVVRNIADEHGISDRFLVQILLQLSSASLVTSKRGSLGGYRLARNPHTITLAEIIDAIEGRRRIACHSRKNTPMVRSILRTCREFEAAQRKRLVEITLSQLVEQAGRQN